MENTAALTLLPLSGLPLGPEELALLAVNEQITLFGQMIIRNRWCPLAGDRKSGASVPIPAASATCNQQGGQSCKQKNGFVFFHHDKSSISESLIVFCTKLPRVRGEDPNREEPHFVRCQSLHGLLSLVSLTLYVSSTHEVPRLNGLMTIHISRGVRPKGQVRTVFTLPYMDQRYGSLIRVHHGPHLLFGEMHHYMLDWGLGRHDPACPRVVRFILR